MKAAIVAGGDGARFSPGKTTLKPLLPVNGVPIIDRIMRSLEKAGVTEVAVIIRDKREVKKHLNAGNWHVKLHFIEANTKNAAESMLAAGSHFRGEKEKFLFILGDLVFGQEVISGLIKRAKGADCELLMGVSKERTLDVIAAVDSQWRVTDYGYGINGNFHGAGLFAIEPRLFNDLPQDGALGELEKGVDLIRYWLSKGHSIMAFDTPGVVDVDTPEDLERANQLAKRMDLVET
ncbi:NDP-sugar synthase [Candidatus Micrarchaeota archaeon]|nr:NDP-sugar synthase [Candidatus Micrarchaeota archaeon]